MHMRSFGLLILILWGNIALAQPTTPACTGVGGKAELQSECCPDLVLTDNPETNLKECRIPNSSTLQYCAPPVAPAVTSATVCTVPGYSCLPQREEDLYPETPEDSPLPESDNNETRKDEGESCEYDTECESFLCAQDPSGSKICQERLVCRLAEAGEQALAPAQCEEGLIKAQEFNPETNSIESNICIDNSAATPYPDLDPNLFNQTGRCSYEVPATKGEKRFSSMVSLRAFEILFEKVSDDKLKLKSFLRDEIAVPLSKSRKAALFEYNRKLREIEKDEELIKNASSESEVLLTIHGSEQVKEKDLALRRASGKDVLLIMWRRNLLNMIFEQKMFEAVSEASQKLGEVNGNISGWRSKYKKWHLANSPSQYGSITNNGKKLKKSYTTRHRIKPKSAALNSDAFSKPGVAEFFSILAEGGITEALPKKKFYLLDAPFMNSDGASFGSAGPLQRNLSGTSKITSMEGIYEDFAPKVADHYKSLFPTEDKEFFVFEPEMVDLGEKNCFLADGTLSDACPKLGKFLEGVQGSAFAQFIAYGAHRKGKYKKFFERSNTLRVRLLKTLEIEFQTIAQYYEELNTSRLAQNTCFSESYDNIVRNFTDQNSFNQVQDDTEGPAGAGTGPGLSASAASSPGSGAGVSNAIGGGSLTRLPEAITLAQNELADRIPGQKTPANSTSLNSLNPSLTNSSTLENGKSGGSSSLSSSSGAGRLSGTNLAEANALSRSKLSAENSKLKLRSQSSEKRAQEIARGFSSLAARSRISSAFASSSSSSSALDSFGKSGGSALSQLDQNETSEIENSEKLAAQSGSSVLKDMSSAGAINYDEAADNSYSNSGTDNRSALDSTGMNEEDKDVLMKNLERTRSRYEGQDTDELFERVSKAYVRNLHRILKRKKVD